MSSKSFPPIPGTRGYITDNGVELVMTHGDFAAIRKACTVTNKAAVFKLKATQKSLAYYETKHKEAVEDGGSDSRSALRLEAIIEEKQAEEKKLRGDLKKEYWADRDDGTLGLPAGFWWMCEKLEGDIYLNTDVPYQPIPVVDKKKPRPYQEECVQELLRFKRASCVMPTGTGKSLKIAMLAWSMVQADKRVCIIEPTIELVDQTYQFLKGYFKDKVAALGGSFKFKPGCSVLVSTIDSAMKHIDIFDCVLVDEFHHSAATTYETALWSAVSGKYFYGFTACATRADGMSLGIHVACGPTVYEKDTKWAIENGFLTPPKIIMVEIGGLGKWRRDEMAAKVYKSAFKHPKVAQVIVQLLQQSVGKGKKTMALFKTVGAGDEVAKWSKKHAKFEFEVASAQYRNPLRVLRKGEANLLVSNSALCGEGVDIPNVDAVLNLTQMSSENMARQILGRGLRIFPGKTELVYVDIVIAGYEPFERAANARLEIYKQITDNIHFIRK